MESLSGGINYCIKKIYEINPQATIYWHLDGRYIGATRELHQMAIAPAPGKHVLTLVDENGEQVRRMFTVLAKD